MKLLLPILLMFTTATTIAKEKTVETNESLIKNTIQTYVSGYLNAEKDLVGKAFNGETRLYSVDNEAIDKTEMQDWFKNLDERKLKGDIRKAQSEILFIDITDNTAVAKISLQFEKSKFTDYLSLLNLHGKWTIVGKIYSAK